MEQADTLVLGIGNVLLGDEGFGVRAAEALAAGWDLGEGVRVADGGTMGIYLLPLLQSARRLIVFDAIDYALAPGSLKLLRDDEVPAYLGAGKMSVHQTGFQEVLAMAKLDGRCPGQMVLIGAQPAELSGVRGELSPAVAARVPEAVDLALRQLAQWGHAPRPLQAVE